MVLKPFLSGLFVKFITGFDDTITQIPVIANLTRTKRGRVAFSIGILLAIIVAIILSFTFASVIKSFPYTRYIVTIVLLLLAFTVYFEIFSKKPKKKAEQEIKKTRKISNKKFFKLMAVGFIAAFATVIDDSFAYSSLFIGTFSNSIYAIIGIISATILELLAIIYFSKKIQNIKYKKHIAVTGLIVLAFLVFFEIL